MAKKKKVFDTKNFTKRIGPAVAESAASTGGFLVGRIAGNKLVEKYPKLEKVQGPAKFLLGAAIIAATDEKSKSAKYIQAAAMGLAANGGNDTVDVFVPDDKKEKIGLAGIASNTSSNDDVYEKLAQEAAEEVEKELEDLNGIYDKGTLPTDTGKDEDQEVPEKEQPEEPEEPVENIAATVESKSDAEFDDMLDTLMD